MKISYEGVRHMISDTMGWERNCVREKPFRRSDVKFRKHQKVMWA